MNALANTTMLHPHPTSPTMEGSMAKFKKTAKKTAGSSGARKGTARKASAQSQAEKLQKTLSESAQQIWLAGVGDVMAVGIGHIVPSGRARRIAEGVPAARASRWGAHITTSSMSALHAQTRQGQ